jgi:hypothetical protein
LSKGGLKKEKRRWKNMGFHSIMVLIQLLLFDHRQLLHLDLIGRGMGLLLPYLQAIQSLLLDNVGTRPLNQLLPSTPQSTSPNQTQHPTERM